MSKQPETQLPSQAEAAKSQVFQIEQLALIGELEFIEASQAKREADFRYQSALDRFLETRRVDLLAKLPADLSLIREKLHELPDLEEISHHLDTILANVGDVHASFESIIAAAAAKSQAKPTTDPQPAAPATEVSL